MRNPRRFEPPPDVGLGLRLRIWLGCLGGGLVAATGLWFAVLWVSAGTEAMNSTLVWVWLPVTASAGILVGLALAMWLDHGIVTPMRAYLRALRSGHVTELRGIPSTSGWGEVSALTQELQEYLARHREMVYAAETLQRLQVDIDGSREALDAWLASERWTPLPEREGALAELTRRLNSGMARDEQLRDQNQDAAVQIQDGLSASIDDARETAEQTERGFVEATAMLTTVRELQRLVTDLDRAGMAPQTASLEPARVAYAGMREAATGAITELVEASNESVRHLSTALLRVREVGDQVQMLGNRATLLALNVMMGRGEASGTAEETNRELRALARDVRVATERAAACTHEVEQEVERSSARMAAVRGRVAETLTTIPDRVEAAPAALPDVARLMERVREMVQDATSKGERLSSAGERASRAAERLVRRLDESVSELEGLAVRLGPIELPSEAAAPTPSATADDEEDDAEELEDPNLRLLSRESDREGDTRMRPGDPH